MLLGRLSRLLGMAPQSSLVHTASNPSAWAAISAAGRRAALLMSTIDPTTCSVNYVPLIGWYNAAHGYTRRSCSQTSNGPMPAAPGWHALAGLLYQK